MCNGTTFEEWQLRCLKNLLELDNVKLALLIMPRAGVTEKRKVCLREIFFRIYDHFIVRPRARRKVELRALLLDVPVVRCKVTIRDKFSQHFEDADIETIRGYTLDFILRFGFGIIRGGILRCARYGIWSFHHGDTEKYRGTPPGFWEIFYGDNVTGAVLQKLTNRLDAGVVLKKGYLKTIGYSYGRNIDSIYFEGTRWPAQVCIDIRNNSSAYLHAPASGTRAPIFKAPSNSQMLLFLSTILKNAFFEVHKCLFRREQWNIGIIPKPISILLDPDFKPTIRWLPLIAKEVFLADPFGIVRNGRLTVICEYYDYRCSRGTISAITLLGETCHFEISPAILLPFHASYPFLFEHQGRIYCIPETFQEREISLYEAEEFPWKWRKTATLVADFAGVDPTIFQYEGKWWLTCTDERGPNHSLFVWYASDPLGPWKPHPANPVKTDIRSARPAGTPFVCNDYLYRPAQDCSKTYGGRVVLNKVTRLTETEFREEQETIIEPSADSPFPDGMHTVSAVGSTTLVDGRRSIFIGIALRHTVIRAIKRFILSST
jgi:hypothetical protein